MDKSRKIKMSQISPFIETQNMERMARKTTNTYESISVISRRANQISAELKAELHLKLEDFATHTDTLEEISENREQIEISKFYEKLPHPALLAMKEFQEDQLSYRYND
jgi:DNA-directed RNA polymerase subunit K/omega